MLLFVDETENEEYFIVTGLLLESRENALEIFRHFKSRIRNMHISSKEKAVVYTEFKSTLLDRKYQRIKIRMIEELVKTDPCIVYSCYIKKGDSFPQEYKEETYLTLLSKIVSSIEHDVSVIFDSFNKNDFEKRIINRLSTYTNVQAIMPRDSQKEPGLQLVDNLCSIIRMHKSTTDKNDFYAMIQSHVEEV